MTSIGKDTVERVFRLTRQQLYDLVWTRSLNALAAEFGNSGNGLAKICDRLMVPHPPRGYWSGGADKPRGPRPPLPPLPDGCDTDVVISPRRAQSRRTRTRLSLTARREQIVEAAAKLIIREGVNAASMKRIAREVGISEALVYNYFPSQTDLLTFIVRREQAEMSQSQAAEMAKHDDYLDRVRGSMVGYLDYVDAKGGLLQTLLGSAEVRAALRQEHQSRRAWSAATSAANMTNTLGVPHHLAHPGTQILRTVGVRTGKLMANGNIDRAEAGRLCRALMDGARERLIALSAAETARPPAPPEAPRSRRASSRGTPRAQPPGRSG